MRRHLPGENATNCILLQYKILRVVFVRYVNIVLVCEHFYHNLWHVTDGLKGLFGFIHILCSFSENFGQMLRAIPGKK